MAVLLGQFKLLDSQLSVDSWHIVSGCIGIISQNEETAVPCPYNIFWVGTRHCRLLYHSGATGIDIIRLADSIGANIAEGDGRGSYQDHPRFIKILRGSLL